MNAQELFGEIADDFRARGVNAGSLFGKPALKVGRKSFACLDGDSMAFRLIAGTAQHTKALGLDGSRLFDPSGKGAPFKDWVSVPMAHSADWRAFADDALQSG